jgi:hypothetical protein
MTSLFLTPRNKIFVFSNFYFYNTRIDSLDSQMSTTYAGTISYRLVATTAIGAIIAMARACARAVVRLFDKILNSYSNRPNSIIFWHYEVLQLII